MRLHPSPLCTCSPFARIAHASSRYEIFRPSTCRSARREKRASRLEQDQGHDRPLRDPSPRAPAFRPAQPVRPARSRREARVAAPVAHSYPYPSRSACDRPAPAQPTCPPRSARACAHAGGGSSRGGSSKTLRKPRGGGPAGQAGSPNPNLQPCCRVTTIVVVIVGSGWGGLLFNDGSPPPPSAATIATAATALVIAAAAAAVAASTAPRSLPHAPQ